MGRFAKGQDESFPWGRLLIGELAADGIVGRIRQSWNAAAFAAWNSTPAGSAASSVHRNQLAKTLPRVRCR
jgi:hypothetical protein